MVLVLVLFAVASGFFVIMVWKFVKARQQFTLRTLLLVTAGVAVLCSAAQYISLAPLLIFLAIPAAEWAWPQPRSPFFIRRQRKPPPYDGPDDLSGFLSG